MTIEHGPALAAAAVVLRSRLGTQLPRIARLLEPRASWLQQRFLRFLRRSGYDARQCKALAAITPGALAPLLRRPHSRAWLEPVEYHARRLAKLNVPPERVLEALSEYDRLLAKRLEADQLKPDTELAWALDQLRLRVALALNDCYYRVREAEAAAYQELFRAELESGNFRDLVARLLDILRRSCQARVGAFFSLDAVGRRWRLEARAGIRLRAVAKALELPAPKRDQQRLSRPVCGLRTRRGSWPALDPAWRRYATCWSVPVLTGQGLAGVFQFAFPRPYEWLPRELELLMAAAERCWLAMEKARLLEHLAAREEQVRRLAEHMMEVEERERRRISAELHDEAGQSLLCVRLQLEMLERKLSESPAELRAGLVEARALTERTILEMRRLIADLSPALLEQFGLAAALKQLVARFRRICPAKVSLRLSRLNRLPGRLERLVYRLVQECLNNVARHSQARHVNLRVVVADKHLVVHVEDDGVGFDVKTALAKRDSFGLAGMRERVTWHGGRFHVESRPGRGCKIRIELPREIGPDPAAATGTRKRCYGQDTSAAGR
ncbi:MAG: GAF domain-containing sensor histidine kinase [Bryobacterales bacterium]|nr:GAF domain-containing sensor histidine kinase [Bryobacterales bacterium]